MGFMLIQNEQRVLHDVAIAALISIGRAFGFDAERTAKAVRVNWIQHEGKWMLGVDVGEPVPGMTEGQVKEVIVEVCKKARLIAVINRKENAYTRYHG